MMACSSSRSSFLRDQENFHSKDVLHEIGGQGKAATMGDEAQKRTTDCVYFLASPLTCKKGNDCEYRHSEAARINPRDCWYWLSGNCLNANCSFRHPPLDGRPGASASAPSPPVTGGNSAGATTAAAPGIASSSSAVPVQTPASKSTVPCYFFSQGFCAKGGKCPFSHGHFRKEATTYRKPQASEQPANGEGNGFSYAKQQSQDSKLASQLKSPVKTGIPLQEAGYVPSNVYRLTVPGGPMSSAPSGKHLPVFTGEKTDRASQVVRSKVVHNEDDSSRQGQSISMESRILQQAQFANDCLQQAPLASKGQLSHFDSGRGIPKQGRQTSVSYNARTSEEMQDPVFEPEAQHGARELHAGDLRNHLKRKKNDTVYLSQQKNFQGKEHLKGRLESGRLASRAVSNVESKDFVQPSNSKRAKQDQETFFAPKTLAQIKAEKTKAGTEGSLIAAESLDGSRGQGQCDSNDTVAPDLEIKRKVQLDPELHDNLQPESCEDCKDTLGNYSGSASEEPKFEQKEAQVPISSGTEEFEGSSGRLRPSVGSRDSNGLSVPLNASRAVHTAGFRSSENAEKQDGNELYISFKREQGLRNEGNSKGSTHSHHNVDVLEGSVTETDYVSADDLMEDGTEGLENVAVAEYASDNDEDDFARKLGSYLS
eukprot:c24093_g1_i2 orf=747-2708(-)